MLQRCTTFTQSLYALPHSGLRQQSARVDRVCGGVAANLQRLPQLHLLLLDKPKLPQQISPGPAEAGSHPLPQTGQHPQVLQRLKDTDGVRSPGQQQQRRP